MHDTKLEKNLEITDLTSFMREMGYGSIAPIGGEPVAPHDSCGRCATAIAVAVTGATAAALASCAARFFTAAPSSIGTVGAAWFSTISAAGCCCTSAACFGIFIQKNYPNSICSPMIKAALECMPCYQDTDLN